MDLKSKIISDLKFGIAPRYRSYGVNKEVFFDAVKELEYEGKVTVTYVEMKLANGERHPYDGGIKKITLRD